MLISDLILTALYPVAIDSTTGFDWLGYLWQVFHDWYFQLPFAAHLNLEYYKELFAKQLRLAII